MAEFLVKWEDNDGDYPGTWKRGMIASPIRPDGFEWGRRELLPPSRGGKFIRIRIPGLSPEEFEAQCETDLGRKPLDPEDIPIDIGIGDGAQEGAGSPSKRPTLRFDLDAFTIIERNMMRSGGARTIAAADLDTRLKRGTKTLADGRADRLARRDR